MSTAANHRKRSRRGYRMERSALGNMSHRAYIRDSRRRYGTPGAGLIYQLQAMRRKILESRKKSEKGETDNG